VLAIICEPWWIIIIIRLLFATSPSTWASYVNEGEGRGMRIAHLAVVHCPPWCGDVVQPLLVVIVVVCSLSVVHCHIADGDVALVFCVKKGAGEGGYGAHLDLVCSSRVVVVSCHIAIGAKSPAVHVRKKRGGVMLQLTQSHEDGDDDKRRHRLDDVARPLMCQVITVSCPGLLTWHCHVIVVVAMCSGGSGLQTVVAEGGGCL
jgi:hypothetical protein